MLQLAIVLAVVVVGATSALWVVALYKLLPLYRVGSISGGYRPMFQFVLVALAWVTMQIIVWLLLHQDAGAAMLSVLWAVGGLSWLLISTVQRTRRNVFEARAQGATPAAGQTARPARLRPAQPDISSYTVRSAPAAAHGNARSARVRRIMSMEA